MTDSPNEKPAPFDLNSDDVAARKRADLKRLFPEVFNEDKIDFDQLRRVMGDWVDEGTERFGLTWPGKAACMKVIQAPATGALRPDRDESVNFDESENVFIEGDNLEVLKLLQKAYFGRVKTIYIDPPYNTGREFIYPDSYAENLQTYLSYTGQVDSESRRFSTNTDTSGRFHSRWLNMMYPRLFLAKNLLREDGVIFISIDDNELSNLKYVCDMLFSENNCLGVVSRATGTTTGQDAGSIGSSLDYMLVYRKSEDFDLSGIPLDDDDEKRFQSEDEKGKYSLLQMRKTGNADRREDRPTMYYAVKSPDGVEVFPIGPGGYDSRWRFGEDTYKVYLADGLIVWKENRSGEPAPYVKYYLEGREKKVSNLWDDIDGNKKGSLEFKEVFGIKGFDNPKPTELIKRITQISTSPNDIMMDFFAGSGTTAHALSKMFAKGEWQGRYILVQLPEPISEESPGAALGYKNLAELARARVARVVKSLGLEKRYGFRAFRLSRSAFHSWSVDSDIESSDLIDTIERLSSNLSGSSDDDILFELLLKDGFDLTTRIEEVRIDKGKAFSVAEGALIICLERNLTKEIIDALANLAEEKESARVVCLDAGFQGNDQLKANAVQTFKSRLGHGEDGSMFRTV